MVITLNFIEAEGADAFKSDIEILNRLKLERINFKILKYGNTDKLIHAEFVFPDNRSANTDKNNQQ